MLSFRFLGAIVVAVTLSTQALACGSGNNSQRAEEARYTSSEVEQAFVSEGADLTEVFDLPNSEMKRLYSGHVNESDLFFVAVFEDGNVAQEHDSSTSSPTNSEASVTREENIVVYLPTAAPETVASQVDRALERLRSLP